jgi:hypothetical protein
MTLDPVQLKKDLFPIPSYADLIKRLKTSMSYSFVRKAYAHSPAQAEDYAQRLLGDDPRQRYGGWLESLQKTFQALGAAGVQDYPDLVEQTANEAGLEALAREVSIPTRDLLSVLKYLVYWALPARKELNRLILTTDKQKIAQNAVLRSHGIRSNLDLLEKGSSPAGREAMAAGAGLPLEFVNEMVHRADLSRMPYMHGKTISHFIGAGYPTLESLAQADLQKLIGDVLRYGKSIGKNLIFGVEPESGGIIACVLPRVVMD